MEIYHPVSLNELGNRANNEDNIYPLSPSEENRIFLVCDGVGGQAKGEVASKLICEYFPEYLVERSLNLKDDSFLQEGLLFVEKKMKNHILKHPECSKMASTLTILCLDGDKPIVKIGWIGDSRVYHIRDGKVLFKTKDHSEIQSLLDMGEITEEEAIDHPKKNVITRAVSGNSSTRISQQLIENIQANDYFLLLSDGILETFKKEMIGELFKEDNDPREIKRIIYNNATGATQDNFSMYLIKIKSLAKKNKKENIFKRVKNSFYE